MPRSGSRPLVWLRVSGSPPERVWAAALVLGQALLCKVLEVANFLVRL